MILPPWDILWICRPARLSAKSEPVHEVSMPTSMRGGPGPVWYWLHTEAVDLIVAQNPLAPLPYQLPVVNWCHLLPPRKHPALKNITLPFPCSACPQNKQLQLLAALAIICCYLLEGATAPQEAQLEPNKSSSTVRYSSATHLHVLEFCSQDYGLGFKSASRKINWSRCSWWKGNNSFSWWNQICDSSPGRARAALQGFPSAVLLSSTRNVTWFWLELLLSLISAAVVHIASAWQILKAELM